MREIMNNRITKIRLHSPIFLIFAGIFGFLLTSFVAAKNWEKLGEEKYADFCRKSFWYALIFLIISPFGSWIILSPSFSWILSCGNAKAFLVYLIILLAIYISGFFFGIWQLVYCRRRNINYIAETMIRYWLIAVVFDAVYLYCAFWILTLPFFSCF